MYKTELRLGNLVEVKITDDKWQPCEVTLHTLTFHEDILRPIKLTEEWLMKLGFRQASTAKYVSEVYAVKRTDKRYLLDIFPSDDDYDLEVDVIMDFDETEYRRIGLSGDIFSRASR